MSDVNHRVLDTVSVKFKDMGDGTHAETMVDRTGQAGGTVVTSAAAWTDPEGQPYWHANLRIDADLADIAQALAPTSPAIAAGLADLARWFVVGPDGKATAPKQPSRVWL